MEGIADVLLTGKAESKTPGMSVMVSTVLRSDLPAWVWEGGVRPVAKKRVKKALVPAIKIEPEPAQDSRKRERDDGDPVTTLPAAVALAPEMAAGAVVAPEAAAAEAPKRARVAPLKELTRAGDDADDDGRPAARPRINMRFMGGGDDD